MGVQKNVVALTVTPLDDMGNDLASDMNVSVKNEMVKWKTEGTAIYQQLARDMHTEFRETEPLREMPADRPELNSDYKTWNETKD